MIALSPVPQTTTAIAAGFILTSAQPRRSGTFNRFAFPDPNSLTSAAGNGFQLWSSAEGNITSKLSLVTAAGRYATESVADVALGPPSINGHKTPPSGISKALATSVLLDVEVLEIPIPPASARRTLPPS